MVNKCSVTGCKSLYVKNNVKLHRFPLANKVTLPLWIAATGRENGWKPCKSSRLCGNHFRKTEYIVGHGKGVLKSTAIPTIEYREEIPRYNKKRNPNIQYKTKSKANDTHVEIVQLDCNAIYEAKYEHKNKDKTDNSNNNNEIPNYTNEHTEQNAKCHTLSNIKILNDENYSNYDEIYKTEYEYDNLNYEIKSDICNRENQCYMFTSSFKGVEPIILPPDKIFEESSNMSIDQSTADSSFNQIMALKLKRQRRTKDIYSLYFKSLKIKGPNFYNDDTASFATFIETQMKELCPYTKLYLTTKHKIQKILMKAQLKIAN